MKLKTPRPSVAGLLGAKASMPNMEPDADDATKLLKRSPNKPPRGMDPKLKAVLLAPGKSRKGKVME